MKLGGALSITRVCSLTLAKPTGSMLWYHRTDNPVTKFPGVCGEIWGTTETAQLINPLVVCYTSQHRLECIHHTTTLVYTKMIKTIGYFKDKRDHTNHDWIKTKHKWFLIKNI